ncbi:MAG TPA: alcohol dehydrogenase catalytic domain-containing protein [Gaiellaceae bacterium]|jgi:L-gulonate 5-dehydrogenase|nr:alcohol dehydrogenase catalytic domain-containing protein [Gaiellaceae bacterium]
MRAAVTQARATMTVVDVPDSGAPGPGQVSVWPEAVGLCGSDFHYFLGDIGAVDSSSLYPRIQGHEAAGVVDEVGPDCPSGLVAGARVAIWPLISCGHCYPCRIGRHNVCANIELVGIHRDGALQERVLLPAAQVFPVGAQDPALSALIEPVSIAVQAVGRGRVVAGERVVVFGAGPIGQAIAVAATDRGADVLLLDRVASRLECGRGVGVEVLAVADVDQTVAAAREWAGGDGPEVVFEATGASAVTPTAVELVSPAGRVVVVGLAHDEAPLRMGDLAFKELDILGVSCCDAGGFAEAVSLVARRQETLSALVTHEFALEQTPEAIVYAIEHPNEVMKAVIRLEEQ